MTLHLQQLPGGWESWEGRGAVARDRATFHGLKMVCFRGVLFAISGLLVY